MNYRVAGRRMIKRFRVGASAEEIENGSDVRFNEFVQDILLGQKRSPNGDVTIVSIYNEY